jgi:hypothetical protein
MMGASEIEELEAVRTEVAEKLGWESIEFNVGGYLVGHPPGRRDWQVIPSYARDIRAAWDLVEDLRRRGMQVAIETAAVWGRGWTYCVEVTHGGRLVARGQGHQAAPTICRAFLRIPK